MHRVRRTVYSLARASLPSQIAQLRKNCQKKKRKGTPPPLQRVHRARAARQPASQPAKASPPTLPHFLPVGRKLAREREREKRKKPNAAASLLVGKRDSLSPIGLKSKRPFPVSMRGQSKGFFLWVGSWHGGK
jgi:hypothetical protein